MPNSAGSLIGMVGKFLSLNDGKNNITINLIYF